MLKQGAWNKLPLLDIIILRGTYQVGSEMHSFIYHAVTIESSAKRV